MIIIYDHVTQIQHVAVEELLCGHSAVSHCLFKVKSFQSTASFKLTFQNKFHIGEQKAIYISLTCFISL